MWWLLASKAFAHNGAVPERGSYDWSNLPELEPGGWIVWEFFPSIVIGSLLMWLGYEWLLKQHKAEHGTLGVSRRMRWSFHIGVFVMFISLQGPLHELSDIYLFSGHMVQHLTITLLFPPLCIIGMPGWMWDKLLRFGWVAAIGRVLAKPLVAFLVSTATLYLWHVPTMYDWALEEHPVHVVEHLTFMITAWVMWFPAFSKSEIIPALTPGKRMLYLFACTLPMKVLGALITVSDYVLYTFYTTQPRVFGMDPLVDQRTGGLIMWVPGGLVFWVSIGFIFFTYYRENAGRTTPAELPQAASEAS